jgi:hypothetical protein
LSRRTTINVSEETKRKLTAIKGKLMHENGKNRSLDDVIAELINYFEGVKK